MRLRLAIVLLAFGVCMQLGCAWLGPGSIRGSRAAYNEAIIRTDSEQLLETIVRIRYGEPSSMLVVSSVTASMHMGATGGAQFGFGRPSNYANNLIPLSIGGDYEDNPTITYTPLQGERYLRQLLSPVPLDIALLLFDAFDASPQLMTLLLRSINGIQGFSFGPGATPADPRFARILELLAALGRDGEADWVERSGATPTPALVLEGEGEPFVGRVEELHRLLGLAVPHPVGRVTRIEVTDQAGRSGVITLLTRSLFQLFNLAATSVDVPAEDLASGIAPPLPSPLATDPGVHVLCSESEPVNAMTAIKQHGYWFSIDAADTRSKLVFRVLRALMSVQMADESDEGPLLTVPVSR